MKKNAGFYVYSNNGKDKYTMFVDYDGNVWSVRRTCRNDFYLCDFDVETYGGYFSSVDLIKAFKEDKCEEHFSFKGFEYSYKENFYSVLDYKHYEREITIKWNEESQKIESIVGEPVFLYQEEGK